MKYFYTLIIVALVTTCINSCKNIYGLKSNISVNSDNIEATSKSYGIKNSFYLVKDPYFSFLKQKTTDSTLIKNHSQPLQAIYFDSSGNIESFHVNCYAAGFPNLNWNKDNILETFPPKSQTQNYMNIKLKEYSDFIKFSHSKDEKIVILFWNNFMGKQTKHFLEQFQKNISKSIKLVKVIYINNDNLYL